MTNKENESRAIADQDLEAVSGGASAGGQWVPGSQGNFMYHGWEVDKAGIKTTYESSNRRELLGDGRTNYWAMGKDGKEFLKGTR